MTQPLQVEEVLKAAVDEAWKQDLRIQAHIVDQMNQIEADVKQEPVEGKRKGLEGSTQ